MADQAKAARFEAIGEQFLNLPNAKELADISYAEFFENMCIYLFGDIISESTILLWPKNDNLYSHIVDYINQAGLNAGLTNNEIITKQSLGMSDVNWIYYDTWISITLAQVLNLSESTLSPEFSYEKREVVANAIQEAISNGHI